MNESTLSHIKGLPISNSELGESVKNIMDLQTMTAIFGAGLALALHKISTLIQSLPLQTLALLGSILVSAFTVSLVFIKICIELPKLYRVIKKFFKGPKGK